MLLVIVAVRVDNSSLLVVDLLRLLVADEQEDGANEEDGTAPRNAVRPPKVPVWPVGGNCVGVMQFRVEEGRIEDERDNDGEDYRCW